MIADFRSSLSRSCGSIWYPSGAALQRQFWGRIPWSRGGGHGSLREFGNSPMEIGHWAEAGIS